MCFYAEPAQFRNLGGRTLSTPLPASGNRNDDRFDVAVLRMSGKGLPPYPLVGKKALPYEMLSQKPPARNGDHHLLIGFPASQAKINRSDGTQTSGDWPIATTTISVDEYKHHRLEYGAHIAMPWKKRKILGRDMKRVNPIGLPGMSGSPLFRILDDDEEGADSGIEVVGVFIEHRKRSSILVATTAAIVVDMIAKLNTDRPLVPDA